MLERHTDAKRINEIVNHPSILPWVRGNHDKLDLTNVAKNPKNVCLVGEHGCVLFIKHQPGVYEFHTSVLPEGRGQWMIEKSKQCFRWMFTRTDAFELMTQCPDGNIAAKAGARAVGCSMMFRTRPIWPTDKGLVSVDVWSIILQDWIKQTPELAETGELFHNELQEKYIALGKTDPIHEEDVVHNQYAGVTCEMMEHGQVNKAVSVYNRFAALSGYKSISVEWEPIIDIFEAKLRIKGDDFDVVG